MTRHALGALDPPLAEWPQERPAYTAPATAVQAETGRWNVPGMAVGILHHASIETASAGITSIASRRPVTDDTIFQIGSISKVFTATLVMQLVEDGVLDLDTPVTTWVPDLPLADAPARKALTLRHLLSHTAGFEGDRFIDYGRGDDALTTAIAAFGSLRQWFAPGDLWSYCNAGFYLAGHVIERTTGKPFETVIHERLIEPLGLATTVLFAEEAITLDHAIGHHLTSREAGHTIAHGYTFPRHVNAAGGIIASTRELLRFAKLHMGLGEIDGTRLISEASARAMQTPVIDAGDVYRHYGIGWAIHEYPDLRAISHGGATRGFRAQLTVVPERDFAIALLTNGETGSRAMQEVEAWALDRYLGFTRPPQATIDMKKKDLAAFAGTYERHDGRFTFRPDADLLVLDYVSLNEETGAVDEERTHTLEPIGERAFRVRDGLAKGNVLDFLDLPGPDGPRALVRSSGRLAERVAAPANAPTRAQSKKKPKGTKRA